MIKHAHLMTGISSVLYPTLSWHRLERAFAQELLGFHRSLELRPRKMNECAFSVILAQIDGQYEPLTTSNRFIQESHCQCEVWWRCKVAELFLLQDGGNGEVYSETTCFLKDEEKHIMGDGDDSVYRTNYYKTLTKAKSKNLRVNFIKNEEQ